MAVVFGCFAVACFVVGLAIPPFAGPRGVITGVVLGIVALFLFSRPAPEADSRLPHVGLAAVYLGTAAAMFAFAPYGSVALPAATFVGLVAAVWLENSKQIAAHYFAATVALLSPSIAGEANLATFMGTCTVVPPSFVLGMAARSVLVLAERQGRRLEDLAMRDPLTGAGNRRHLDEQLDVELDRATATRRPLTVFALDLNGFKLINDTLGHAAGDRVLRDVAARLMSLGDDRMTVSRLGGDEFVVVSPATDPARAEELADELIAGLGPAISAGIGWATYPHDADHAQSLLETADARLIARKAAHRDDEVADAAWVHELVLPEPITLAHAHELVTRKPRRPLTRDVLGAGRVIWRITGVMFLFFAGVAAMFINTPQLDSPMTVPGILLGVGIGVVALCTRPPALHTWGSDLILALSYLVPAFAIVGVAPEGSALIGFGLFVGPLVAVRTRTRARAAAHVGASLLVMAGIAVFGGVDAATVLAMAMLGFTNVVLAFYCVFVLELVEAEGGELERLSALDPLTLLANRRRLAEGLGELVDDAAACGQELAIVAMDLNGFKHLNDTVGHGAGDLLLVEVAECLRAVASGDALASRPGGDEFTLVLPGHDRVAAAAIADQLRASISALQPSGCPISTGIGIAMYPDDAREPDALLATADARLIADKYGREPASTPTAA